MSYSTLEVCSGRAAYEAIPRPKLSLDLGSAKRKLEGEGIAVVDARVMLIAQMASEVTLARDGRVLIKTAHAATAKRVFDELARILELPHGADGTSR